MVDPDVPHGFYIMKIWIICTAATSAGQVKQNVNKKRPDNISGLFLFNIVNIKKQLGIKIKRLRQKRGLTQEQLA